MKHRIIFLAILFALALYGMIIPAREATTAAHPSAAPSAVHVAQRTVHHS